ncbi:MAG: hypothetical protein D6771_05085 [Zetaproteobacteria bacterium]|nr:MAG: hypothetical protein D6771_05085 [Zetaproteobacteria bacterium]
MGIVERIRELRLASYASTSQDIRQHWRLEERERRGYCKRPLLELLQNIEDALKDEPRPAPQAAFVLRGDTLWVLNKGRRSPSGASRRCAKATTAQSMGEASSAARARDSRQC